ncbi:MAG: hypothetical protein OXI43_13560 [Candidatus Poribacteria bacterium]|nr:hypothetical protein [Candidatus Poribacteria bacterium]
MKHGRLYIIMIGVVLSTIIFTLSITGLVSAAVIDKNTVEFAYLFDEGAGVVAKDASVNGRDGAISGAKYVEGKFGTCLEYDGVDDNLVATDYFGVGGINPRTTVFWFKSRETREHSWVKWGPDSPGEKYYIRAHVRGAACNLRVEVNGGNNFGTDNVCDGEWHHCAVVFPKGSDAVKDHDLYVDGKLQVKEGIEKAMNTNDRVQEVNMGNFLASHSFMFGLFDEVAVFNVDLTLDQINAIREQGLGQALGVDPRGKLATNWAMIKTY